MKIEIISVPKVSKFFIAFLINKNNFSNTFVYIGFNDSLKHTIGNSARRVWTRTVWGLFS